MTPEVDGRGRVRAAGGLVLLDRQVLLVHRPRYDDWTFPKGKVERGESDEAAALREVYEETRFVCELGPELVGTEYVDNTGRPKAVRYWQMHPVQGSFSPTVEVDDVRWLSPSDARALLTYDHDRSVLDALDAFAPEDHPVYLVRHAKAGDRAAWTEDDRLRPLSKRGRRQAEALVPAFQGRELARIISSPYVRCEQTVRPLALDRGLPLETTPRLAEGAPLEGMLALLDELTGVPAVVCGHGDLIPETVDHLRADGVPVDEGQTKKGSTWILERRTGSIVRARYVPPPLLD